jgi:hypothetical protein
MTLWENELKLRSCQATKKKDKLSAREENFPDSVRIMLAYLSPAGVSFRRSGFTA